MEIKVVSVVSEAVASVCRNVTVSLEDSFKPIFLDTDFGADIKEFTFAIVAVDEDSETNERFCEPHNKIGRYKHWLTQETVKFISFALPFKPDAIEGKPESEVVRIFLEAALFRLDNPGLKIPRGFDYVGFAAKFKDAAAVILKATA